MVFKVKFFDLIIEIHSLYETTMQFCEDYLTQDGPPHFTVVITQEDIETERILTEKEYMAEGKPFHLLDLQLELNAVHRKICMACIQHNIFMMHGSVVAVEQCAYMFTALSGTGKTTHANLWLKNIPGSFIVNGDKPFLHVAETVSACGSPWCGKEFVSTNIAVPLKAIVLLERSATNEISEISFQEAFPILLTQTYRNANPAHLSTTLGLIQKAAQSLRFYRLKCNMEDEAALVAFQALHRASDD